MSPKAHRIVVNLSLRVLQDAVTTPPADGEIAGVRLALRCLLSACPDKALLTAYRSALTTEVDLRRQHGLARAYEAVAAAVRIESV
jgi:hypothetical protein